MGDPWTLLWVKEVRWKRSHIVWFHLYDMFRISKFIKAESRLAFLRGWVKAGENEEWLLMSMCFLSGVTEIFGIREWWLLHNNMNILKITKLYSLKEWILWYVHYISIKMRFWFLSIGLGKKGLIMSSIHKFMGK